MISRSAFRRWRRRATRRARDRVGGSRTRRRQTREQERGEAAQQQLVVGRRRRGASSAISFSASVPASVYDSAPIMKCSRHDSSRFGRSGSARRERRLEALDHRRVLLAQEAADERRGVGVGASEQAQEVRAAALAIARELERGHEQRGEDLLARDAVGPALALERVSSSTRRWFIGSSRRVSTAWNSSSLLPK